MAEQYVPGLGRLIDGEARRDAVHVAVAPVTAGHDLGPADRVFLRDGVAVPWMDGGPPPVGVVDPFLEGGAKAGRRFWLFLYPGTVTSLRHVWTHPAFAPAAPAGKEEEAARDV